MGGRDEEGKGREDSGMMNREREGRDGGMMMRGKEGRDAGMMKR